MNISKSAFENALRKLNLSPEVLYNEKGIIRAEYVLIDIEKNSVLYYVESDEYLKKEKSEFNQESAHDDDCAYLRGYECDCRNPRHSR